MKKIFEEILEIGFELLPMMLFVSVIVALVLGGQMNTWLNTIATWMFG